jgi:hypothetical protein
LTQIAPSILPISYKTAKAPAKTPASPAPNPITIPGATFLDGEAVATDAVDDPDATPDPDVGVVLPALPLDALTVALELLFFDVLIVPFVLAVVLFPLMLARVVIAIDVLELVALDPGAVVIGATDEAIEDTEEAVEEVKAAE